MKKQILLIAVLGAFSLHAMHEYDLPRAAPAVFEMRHTLDGRGQFDGVADNVARAMITNADVEGEVLLCCCCMCTTAVLVSQCQCPYLCAAALVVDQWRRHSPFARLLGVFSRNFARGFLAGQRDRLARQNNQPDLDV